ncbi:NPCBM/NEW2 domain-containing protein [Streptomyces lunaelactis]|uniref:NPCBM/NEW2 domain-containing protein n=1 Tax=Streptomyces lunaelactis TaxID=1535768 RepID=UPI0015845434|nr:NPCBM/NEW2 domain-containing protein [Streptomyces lunaelactis]NUK37851.1 NPCBM/NEW2 domain-containing protein [Streptomyces lunaelactis]NUK44736.1 NPCBM/NEW2 domain-containing protein [Streptomyces lunaelactis]NUK81813.1 NPCBM/NEW2 domain-containing protein [Streptomyces lunaelactis]NUK91534.1 NPCBM/NEW2 domain-containing protein [Streptomyces lunaelactis]NUL29930.1 NPCBM/NEW2 domain-containing protein [Streptomyces lunaelactis]
MRSPKRFRSAVVAALIGLLAAVTGPAGSAQAEPADTTVGDVTGFAPDGPVYRLTAGNAVARVSFVSGETFRIELAPDGTFTDPTGQDIVLPQGAPPATHWSDKGDRYELGTSKVTLRAYKSPLRFALHRADGTQLWAETTGLTWGQDKTTQTLARGAAEQYYGAGMQNGRGNTSHRGKTVEVGVDYNWDDGGHPNSVPFYLSSEGYGVYRNTYAPNTYAFNDPVTATAKEQRFDAYYFAGPSAKDVIGQYTKLTGKPFLPPVYGLEIGDADCYLHNANRGERHTLDALKVADGYVQNDMPNGWMLVNDGYGCGYEDLAETAKGLQDRKTQMGLWTEDGIGKLAEQVRAGQRVAKLDVAWVGDGYKFALDGCKDAYKGIEENSDARGFTWAPESWSGAQRCGVQWSGDQSGSWEYIRWQIPTYAGASMSGLAYTTGDVDGIFGGSPKTYARDLQWKMFLPVTMTMDGWAASDKQPFRYGEPYTSVNRDYLKLHESLLPYIYSYAHEATRTGVGLARPLALEYPDDPEAATDAAKYEFLSGEDFLVAPVYQDAVERDGIYLPKGTWIDYWSGRSYEGPVTVDDYSAPLDTLPLFVKAGATVPMWPGIRSYADRTAGSPLAWDIYPQGKSSFTLYEDDGVTRQHRGGKYATQRADVDAPRSGAGDVRVRIGASKGEFTGKQSTRPYHFSVHTGDAPSTVGLDGRGLPRRSSKGAYEKAAQGWWYDQDDRGGVVHVKTPSLRTDRGFELELEDTSAVGGRTPGAAVSVSVPAGQELGAGAPGKVAVDVTAGGRDATGVQVSLNAPAGWQITPAQTVDRIPAGTTKRVEVAVTPAVDAKPGEATLTAAVRHRAAGVDRTSVQRFAVGVMPPPPAADAWASDLVWLRSTNGYGPAERDRSNGESGAADGHPLTLAGTTYEKGIGVHADSGIEVYLGGRCTSLTADVGIDDEINGYGEVAFSVEADGKVLWTSPKVTGASATVPVDVRLEGARHVRLNVSDTNGSKTGDHGDWAAARFSCA